MARPQERRDVEEAGASPTETRKIMCRTLHDWAAEVPVEHQDLILSALERLSSASTRREEIYRLGAAAALEATPRATHAYVKELVREENARLTQDPLEAFNQRRFTMRSQDEHGGVSFFGYVPAAHAALLKALMDQAWRADQADEDARRDENRTVAQRHADDFFRVLKWASSERRAATGHCSLVVGVTDTDEFNWQACFGSNVGIDLTMFDLAMLDGQRVVDYIAVHDHHGAMVSLYTTNRTATFQQRLAMFSRDGCCVYPGCDEPISRCQSHHVLPWARGGPTHVANLAPLCSKHHGWNDDSWLEAHISMTLQGLPHLVDATGTTHRNNSPAARKANGRRLVAQLT